MEYANNIFKSELKKREVVSYKYKFMKLRYFFIAITAVVTFIPIISLAETIPWNTQEYRAYAYAKYGTTEWVEELYGPPLPIEASVLSCCGSISWSSARSRIESSYMYVAVEDVGGWPAYATASFLGTYTSTSSNPLFNFSYSIVTTSGATPPNQDYWLNVNDLTDNANLYYNNALSTNAGTITIDVPTTPGHEISVNFLISNEGVAYPSQIGSAGMTYNMAVAPEPISSILFVTGGAVLAGRLYRKRRRGEGRYLAARGGGSLT